MPGSTLRRSARAFWTAFEAFTSAKTEWPLDPEEVSGSRLFGICPGAFGLQLQQN